jgi:outer membrane protein assembly factor BamB
VQPDTADLRAGPEIHSALLALLPLVGVWRGGGAGVSASGEQFAYGEQITFAHDGRPFLACETRSWLLDSAGATIRQAWRETGFWRPGPRPDELEVILASNTGQASQYTGTAGDLRWEIVSRSITPAPSAVVVDGERRLYAITDDELVYATEMAFAGGPFTAHLNARLRRV